MREISPDDAIAIVERFQTDIDCSFYTRIILETIHYHLAREWISRFTTPLRTLDALHLAVASQNNIRLATADAVAASAQFLGVDTVLLQ